MFIQRGKTDIEIRCVVNCSNLTNKGILLMRSNESIVSLSLRNGIGWQDLELKNRSEAKSEATCSDNDFTDLNMKIPSSMVNPLKDIGPYLCKVLALASNGGIITKDSQIVMLNITGNQGFLFSLKYFQYFYASKSDGIFIEAYAIQRIIHVLVFIN